MNLHNLTTIELEVFTARYPEAAGFLNRADLRHEFEALQAVSEARRSEWQRCRMGELLLLDARTNFVTKL